MEHQRTFSDTLVVVYGLACPLDCDFCCHSTEEYGPGRMDREEALDPALRYADRLFGAVEDLCRQEACSREEVPRA